MNHIFLKSKTVISGALISLAASMAIFIFIISLAVATAQEQTEYTQDIEQKITSRCSIIKEYLSEQVRVTELSSRQNRVRGWEFLLRNLDSLKGKYSSLGLDQSVISTDLTTLAAQLEQFKLDFEAYDVALQRLINTDCSSQPQLFWERLLTVRSFRASIATSAQKYTQNIHEVIDRQQQQITTTQ